MQFSYKRYPNPNGIAITRPVIPITLQNLRASQPSKIGYEALVDTGSDRWIFPAELADLLDIDLRASTKILYVAGVVAGDRSTCTRSRSKSVVAADRCSRCSPASCRTSPRAATVSSGATRFFDQFSFVKFKNLANVIEIGKRQRP